MLGIMDMRQLLLNRRIPPRRKTKQGKFREKKYYFAKLSFQTRKVCDSNFLEGTRIRFSQKVNMVTTLADCLEPQISFRTAILLSLIKIDFG